MKILVFTDIHGNLNGLTSLMKTKDFKSADKVIFLGDVMFGCSRPNECVDLIKTKNIECLVGNNDYYAFDHIPKSSKNGFAGGKGVQMEYMRKVLSSENAEEMKSWKKDLFLKVDDKKLYFVHYPWREENDEQDVVQIPMEEDFSSRANLFEGIDADYFFFGHEHIPNKCEVEGKSFYCVGTLGLTNPGSYLLIDASEKEIKIENKSVEHNIKEEALLMDKAGYPYNKKKIKIS